MGRLKSRLGSAPLLSSYQTRFRNVQGGLPQNATWVRAASGVATKSDSPPHIDAHYFGLLRCKCQIAHKSLPDLTGSPVGAHDATAAVAVAEQEMADFMGDDFRQDGGPGCILGVGKFECPVEKDVRVGGEAVLAGSGGQSEFPGVGSDLAGHAFGQNCDRDEGTDVGVRSANRVATSGALEVAPVDFDTGPAEGGFGAKLISLMSAGRIAE